MFSQTLQIRSSATFCSKLLQSFNTPSPLRDDPHVPTFTQSSLAPIYARARPQRPASFARCLRRCVCPSHRELRGSPRPPRGTYGRGALQRGSCTGSHNGDPAKGPAKGSHKGAPTMGVPQWGSH